MSAPSAQPFVLLENSHRAGGASFLFEDPVEVVTCHHPADLERTLARVAEAPAKGLYAAGYLSYEAGYHLEPKLASIAPAPTGFPLLWFGLFRTRRSIVGADFDQSWQRRSTDSFRVDDIALSVDSATYRQAIERVHEYIRAGDTYQVNYTLKYHFGFGGSPDAFYAALRSRQRTEFSARIRAAGYDILSLSPELFFRKEGARVTLKPMKGTGKRGANEAEDRATAEALLGDPKTRAENIMIVDLMRNDVGRIARSGSVQVPELLAVEAYESVLQLTSTVVAEVEPTIDFGVLMRNLFPCGSVTGAPKIRTMEIIRELEREPRGIYTGAIGFLTPENDACFSVAIRTVVLGADGRGEMGVGGGIMADSDAAREYDECLLKGRFMTGLTA
jgi:para-aminobenzoate synthetase / 4-amino-4-deoxychorismate lyase